MKTTQTLLPRQAVPDSGKQIRMTAALNAAISALEAAHTGMAKPEHENQRHWVEGLRPCARMGLRRAFVDKCSALRDHSPSLADLALAVAQAAGLTESAQ